MLGSAAEAEEWPRSVPPALGLAEFRGDAAFDPLPTSRLCLNRLAWGGRAVRGGEEILLRVADERGGPDARAESGELEAALHRAIAELPEERRVVIILRDLEGLSYEEIAHALDLEPGTVRSRIHRARMDLREKLERFLP
jgi:RNA polymerase sigma factor (sigma-70 family)